MTEATDGEGDVARNAKQYPAAKRQWDARTGERVVSVRLDAGYRARLDRLARQLGSHRKAIEAGIAALERTDDR